MGLRYRAENAAGLSEAFSQAAVHENTVLTSTSVAGWFPMEMSQGSLIILERARGVVRPDDAVPGKAVFGTRCTPAKQPTCVSKHWVSHIKADVVLWSTGDIRTPRPSSSQEADGRFCPCEHAHVHCRTHREYCDHKHQQKPTNVQDSSDQVKSARLQARRFGVQLAKHGMSVRTRPGCKPVCSNNTRLPFGPSWFG